MNEVVVQGATSYTYMQLLYPNMQVYPNMQ